MCEGTLVGLQSFTPSCGTQAVPTVYTKVTAIITTNIITIFLIKMLKTGASLAGGRLGGLGGVGHGEVPGLNLLNQMVPFFSLKINIIHWAENKDILSSSKSKCT